MRGPRSAKNWARWCLLAGVPLLALGGWLAVRAGLVQRVYVYSERGSRLEVDGAAQVRSVSWSAPREVPDGPTPAAPAGPALRDGPVSPGCILVSSRTQAGDFDIFAREFTASGWSAATALGGEINSPSDEVTPCLSVDGNAIFFASNRPGGLGGFDLYSSRRGPDGWSKPVNLGPRVNSPYDDTGPALHPTGAVLAFATTRPRSFVLSPPADWSSIIVSSWKAADECLVAVSAVGDAEKGRRWIGLQLLEKLDSPARDLEPCFSPDGGFIYFSSSREGGSGGFDIYRARSSLAGEQAVGDVALLTGAPENAGRPLNSVYDERAPRLFLDGLAIAFQASVQGTTAENLFESRTREVDAELAFANIPFGVLAESLARMAALAVGGLVLAALVVIAFRYRRALRVNLMLRCASAAVLLHAALLYGFYFWVVSDKIVALAEKARVTEISVEKLLQAKLTMEAARIDVKVPDAQTSAAQAAAPTRLIPQKPLGQASESAALAVFEPAGPAPTPTLESSAALALPPLDSFALPSNREPAPVADVAKPAATPSGPPVLLPAPKVEAAAPQPADISERIAASLKLDASTPRQGPVSTVEERAESPPSIAVEPYVQAASTQVRADVPLAPLLPPLARPILQTPRESPALPSPSRSSEPEPAGVVLEVAAPSVSPERAQDGARVVPLTHAPDVTTVATAPGATPQSLLPLAGTPVGLLAASRDHEGARELAEGAQALPWSARASIEAPKLPDSQPASASAPGEPLVAADVAPRRGERHSEAGPLVVGALAATAVPIESSPDARPLMAAADTLSPLAGASPVRLEPEARPGAFADAPLPKAAPFVAKGTPSLPEADGGARPTEGAPQVADLLMPSPKSRKVALASSLAGEARPATASFRPEAATFLPRPEDAARIAAAPTAPRSPSLESKPPIDAAPRPERLARVNAKLPEAPPELEGETDIRKVRATATRKALVGMMGGTAESEDAVLRSLRWLARHQSRDGRWDVDGFDASCQGCSSPGFQVDCDAAISGLALLCFLGQNHTPKNAESPFRKTVGAAIDWLVSIQTPSGCLAGDDQRYTMYSHGIVTLALSEAYILTGDDRLKEPVRRAVQLIVSAQNRKTGGWRYQPKPPLRGDTSITGWQILALTSARSAGIQVPEAVFDRARHWFDVEAAGGEHGGIYGYTRPEEPRVAMTAEGMFARLLLGAKRTDRNIDEAARYIHSETRSGGYLDNLYLLYYGNLALYHYQGWIWERWNEDVREFLVRSQQRSGTLAGSWDPSGPWTETGGRVLSTCFATLTLEVYYRYLPLYWTIDGGPERAQAPR